VDIKETADLWVKLVPTERMGRVVQPESLAQLDQRERLVLRVMQGLMVPPAKLEQVDLKVVLVNKVLPEEQGLLVKLVHKAPLVMRGVRVKQDPQVLQEK